MHHHYIPKGSIAYSPKGVRDKFNQAIEKEGGDILKVIENKHKYKALIELWYASFFALAIYKLFKNKYIIYGADNNNSQLPDTFFLNEENNEAFPVEITEFHNSAEDIWKAKGNKQFDRCYLLIICRKNIEKFDVSEFSEAIQKHDRKFESIWLGVYNGLEVSRKFFELLPIKKIESMISTTYSFKDKNDLQLYY